MSIAIQVHGRNDPAALAELIRDAIEDDSGILEREPVVAHLSALVEREELEGERRRAAWHWLNSVSTGLVDRDNDWSDV